MSYPRGVGQRRTTLERPVVDIYVSWYELFKRGLHLTAESQWVTGFDPTRCWAMCHQIRTVQRHWLEGTSRQVFAVFSRRFSLSLLDD